MANIGYTRQSNWAFAFRQFRRDWVAVLALVVLVVIVISAVFAPIIAPRDPTAQDLGKRLLLPYWMRGGQPDYVLGADQLGRDLLSRIIYGGRVSLIIGVVAVLI